VAYRQLIVEGGTRGLNLAKKVDELDPGESSVANNIEFFGSAIARRKGFRLACKGALDLVLRGGPASQSIGLVGEERWVDTRPTMRSALFTEDTPITGGAVNGRRDFFNQRPSIVVIPEGNTPGLRLNVRDADSSWAIEFLIRPDEVPFFHGSSLSTSPVVVPIPAQKGMGTTGQWAVRVLQDATSDRFYVALTLYEGGVLGTAGAVGNPTTPTANATDFFFQSGGNRAWIEPGKRHWFAWKFIKGAPGVVTSLYWQQGMTSTSSSTQNSDYLHATLRTNGVGSSNAPITLGRRPFQAAGRLGIGTFVANNAIDEMGFLGSIPELRFWQDTAQGVAGTLELPANWGVVTASPPASTDWYVEREIPQEQLTTDAAVEAANLVQTTDLQLYFQLKPELIGFALDGTAIAGENDRMIRPRFTRGTALDNLAWVSGADATWVDATGILGKKALAFCPALALAGQKYVFADVCRSGKTDSYNGKRLFCAGIRIPNANLYMRRASSGTASAWEFPDEFGIRAPVRLDALPSNTAFRATIYEINVARRGTGPNFDRYGVSSIFRVGVAFDGANWKFRLQMRDATGVATTLDSTTNVVEGTAYTIQAAVRFEQGNRVLSIFVDGARENTVSAAATKPWMSETSATDSTDPNRDDDDGRDSNFPTFIGCSVETPISVDSHPDPFAFRYGAYGIGGGGIGVVGANRAYWGWGTNDTQRTPNDGIGYHGHDVWVGPIGSLQVWQKYPSESEARALAPRGPSGEEMQRDGAILVSNWEFEEGQGTACFDLGYLKNHLRINPLPTGFVSIGSCDRVERPPLLGIFQQRQLSTIGAPDNRLFGLSHGVLHEIVKDGSNALYATPIGRCRTPEQWSSRSRSPRLPTAFQFSGALNVCTGSGPVKRVFDGKVSDLGLTPVYGDIGSDQTHLGWREPDRDGTFQIFTVFAAATPADTVFAPNRKYGWCCTFYDPDSGLESAPSKLMYLKIDPALGANGQKAILLTSLPKCPQLQAAKRRIYRTTADGGVFRFLAEIDADATGFTDSILDSKITANSVLTSWLNYPPPQNACIGLAFGARALYFGVHEKPDTLFYSLLGFPGACPTQYQLTLASGHSTELVAGVVINDRCYLFTRTSTFAVFDSGGDITVDNPFQPPVQLYQLRDDLGCISHQGIVVIEGVGAIIPTEQGLYLFDGQSFRNLGIDKNGDDRVKLFWQQMNLANSRNFVAVAHKRKKQYILWCSTSCSLDAANDRALVYDWGKDAFSIQTQRDVLFATTIADDASGQERVWTTTLGGEVFEFDPPEIDIDSDGPEVSPFSGSIVAAKLDPLGSGRFTRLQLVSDNSLPTTGKGLRGVNLYVTDDGTQWHFRPLKILWNDANNVLVAGDAGTTTPIGFEWRLGPIGAQWLSGKFNQGSDVTNVRILRVQFNLNPSSGQRFVTQCMYDEQSDTAKFADPALQFAILSGVSGRGKRYQIRMHDITRFGGLPQNAWSVARFEIHYQPRGRSSYVPS